MAVSLSFKIVKIISSFLASRKREAFISACKNPSEVQDNVLRQILKDSKHPMPEAPVSYQYYEDRKDLTYEPVQFFETTSGSTGNKKQIPYTKPFVKTFENMFLLWADDLISHSGSNLSSGKFFMSISPRIGEESKDDRKYLSAPIAFLLKPFLASNPNTHFAKNGDEFLFKVASDLILCKELEIISIWSPTYLLSLLQFMEDHKKELGIEKKSLKEIWPHLRLISCWTHAQASRPANLLREKFPEVMIQSKGLLLTEGAVTLPWSEAGGCIPLLTEGYYEFMDSKGSLHKLHDIEKNETYTVIMSQPNGFLRYNTNDLVKVTGFYHRTPILEFMGREGQYSDLAGEKFSEAGLRELGIDANFLVVPDDSGELPCYKIFTESDGINWDELFKANYHYRLAREIKQISSPDVKVVKSVHDYYLKFFQSQGMSLGDIKEKILLNDINLARKFLAWIDKELPSSR